MVHMHYEINRWLPHVDDEQWDPAEFDQFRLRPPGVVLGEAGDPLGGGETPMGCPAPLSCDRRDRR
jgi:hypothetical protein